MALTAVDAEQLYRSELERINRLVHFACRRHGLSPEDADDFHSEVHVKLLDKEYRLLRGLEDPLCLVAFLAVVLQRLMLDFRVQRWGKWRPSRPALCAGEMAVRLETMVLRDGIEFDRAVEMLHANFGARQSRDELYALLLTFPMRRGRAALRDVSLEQVGDRPGPESTDRPLLDEADEATEDALSRCLRRRLHELPAEDRLILRMVFLDGHRVSTVARSLGLDQRSLYRRLERLQGALRQALESEGVTRERALDLMGSCRGLQLELREIFDRSPSVGEQGPAQSAGSGAR